MSQSNPIKTALQAADEALLLRSEADVARAAKAWNRCARLGLDTEFVRERTYTANLGLVQISDGKTVWLLDPLVPGSLEPLRQLLLNPTVEKIFHSPSEDLDVLASTIGALPEPMTDTQVACALLGQALQMGYHTAVEWAFDIKLDKEQTRSNWCARPLRKAQLHYAALDVCLLPLLWEKLEEALQSKGRLGWLEEECERQLDRARTRVPDGELWRRIRGAGRLDGESLAILQALADWRESRAVKLNRPRGFIVPDPVLLAIAEQKLQSSENLLQLEGMHPRAAARYGPSIGKIVNRVLESGLKLETIPKLHSRDRRLLKDLRMKVQEQAQKIGLDPAVLASRRDLEEMLLMRSKRYVPERLSGWRMNQITRELLDMIGNTS